jgi:hypothetical protein
MRGECTSDFGCRFRFRNCRCRVFGSNDMGLVSREDRERLRLSAGMCVRNRARAFTMARVMLPRKLCRATGVAARQCLSACGWGRTTWGCPVAVYPCDHRVLLDSLMLRVVPTTGNNTATSHELIAVESIVLLEVVVLVLLRVAQLLLLVVERHSPHANLL